MKAYTPPFSDFGEESRVDGLALLAHAGDEVVFLDKFLLLCFGGQPDGQVEQGVAEEEHRTGPHDDNDLVGDGVVQQQDGDEAINQSYLSLTRSFLSKRLKSYITAHALSRPKRQRRVEARLSSVFSPRSSRNARNILDVFNPCAIVAQPLTQDRKRQTVS